MADFDGDEAVDLLIGARAARGGGVVAVVTGGTGDSSIDDAYALLMGQGHGPSGGGYLDQRGWTIAVLKSSRRDVAAETERRLAEARARYDRLGRLIDGAYEDKLEGRIDLVFFNAKRTEWEGQRSEAQREMERLAQASARNMDMAIAVFELSNSAYDLLSRREPLKQRRLLEILLSNSELAAGELTVTFRKPFSYLASWRDDPDEQDPSGGDSGGARSEWSGRRDSNPRLPAPEAGALPGCATPRQDRLGTNPVQGPGQESYL